MKSNKQVDKKRGLPEPPSNPKMKKQKDNENNIATSVHSLKSQAVPIGLFTTRREQLKDTIILAEFFEGVRSGKWRKEAEAVRKCKDDPTKYDAAKKKAPAVWLQHLDLLVFDYDHDVLDIEDKYILAEFKSIGGRGRAILVPIPAGLNNEEKKLHRKKLQHQYNFVDNQTAYDRCRLVSFDPGIKVNWDSEIRELNPVSDEQLKKFKDSIWRETLASEEIMNYDARLSVYSGLRCEGKSTDEVLKQFLGMLKAGRFKAKTTDKHIRTESIKWEKDFGDSYLKVTIKGFEKTNPTDLKDTISDWDKLYDMYGIPNEKPEDEPVLIKFGDVDVCTSGNHSLLVGKKKARKTLLIAYMIKLYKDQNIGCDISKDVLVIDTEQGKTHAWRSRNRIYKVTGKHVPGLSVRGESPKIRKKVIELALQFKPTIKLLVIDGVRDLVSDINDPTESSEIVTWLEMLTEETGIHIINILHLNKTDNNARGHLGSELLNKGEVTIEVTLHKKKGMSVVSCESTRGIDFDDFGFTHDLNGLPTVVDVPQDEPKFTTEQTDPVLKLLGKARLKKKQLSDLIMNSGIVEKPTRVSNLIEDMLLKGLIQSKGNSKYDKNKVYFIS